MTRRSLAPARRTLVLTAALLAIGASAATAGSSLPHLALRGKQVELTVSPPSNPGGRTSLFVSGLSLTNSGGDLTLKAVRTHGHVAVAQDVGGSSHPVASVTATRRRPYTLSDGLPDALLIELRRNGKRAGRFHTPWCPTLGTTVMTPHSCGDPLSQRTTWLVAHGQRVLVLGVVTSLAGKLRSGRYRATISLGASKRLRLAKGSVTVWRGAASIRKSTSSGARTPAPPDDHKAPPTFHDQPAGTGNLAGVPLPDLLPLPAENLNVVHDRKGDFLHFDSDVANRGTDLVVDGSVKPGDPAGSMEATQVLTGPAGRVLHPAGHLVFDNDDGHNHWHFFNLAHYRLTRAGSDASVRDSTKIGFCFGDTDPFDMSAPGAQVQPIQGPLHEVSCEHRNPSATSVHMVLTAGWLDRYDQLVAGQAFDVTKLRNGRYSIVIDVNPFGFLAETTAANNHATRTFTLGGKPGHRTVSVPPVDGVYTERIF